MRILFIPLFLIVLGSQAQSIVGKWKTVDENSGEERSMVEIFERGDKLYGKVIKIYSKPGEDPDPVCDKCPEDDIRFNKKIINMEIIQDMKKSGNEYIDGHILDPEVGKIYRCKLWMDGKNLMVRGYWGPFYRTQTWERAN